MQKEKEKKYALYLNNLDLPKIKQKIKFVIILIEYQKLIQI